MEESILDALSKASIYPYESAICSKQKNEFPCLQYPYSTPNPAFSLPLGALISHTQCSCCLLIAVKPFSNTPYILII